MSATKRRYDTSNRPGQHGRDISTRVSNETVARVRRVAEERRWSQAATYRNLIEDALDREEAK